MPQDFVLPGTIALYNLRVPICFHVPVERIELMLVAKINLLVTLVQLVVFVSEVLHYQTIVHEDSTAY